MRISVLAIAISSALIGLAMADPAAATAIKTQINIAPQELSNALRLLAADRNLQILYTTETVADRHTAGAVGEFTVVEALTRLLGGTGLAFHYVDDTTITIVPLSTMPSRGRDSRSTSGTPEAGTAGSALGGEAKGKGFWNRLRIAQAESSSSSANERAAHRSTDSAPRPSQIEEIIVTAQKREERLIDIPQSVSVLSQHDIERLNALQFRDFANTVPGLTFATSGAGQNQVALRGVTAGADVSPTVGIYVDEVPYGSSTPFAAGGGLALDLALFDMQRIEVLRGPQGTLYGASTMGGLIKYIAREPELNSSSGRVRAGASGTKHGDHSYDGSAVLNVPLVSDVAALRVGGYYAEDGGYVDNVGLGDQDVNTSEIYGGRLDLLFRPNSDLSVRIAGAYQDIGRDGRATAEHTLAGAPVVDDLSQRRATAEPFDQSFALASVTVEYALDWADLISISSYQSTDSEIGGDLTPVYVPLLGFFGRSYSAVGQRAINTTDRFSQEVRFSSQRHERIQWLVGAFFTNEDSQSDVVVQPYDLTGSPATPDIFNGARPSSYEERAFFGNLTWKIADRFDVSAGLRYASDEIETSNAATGLLASAAQPTTSATDQVVTYLANARYHLTDSATAYVRYATGYRPGGPNFVTIDLNTGLPSGPLSYESDSLDSFEIGLHAESDNRRIGMDAAMYYIDWSNIQVQVFRPSTGFGGIINAPAGAQVRGAELAVFARVSEGLRLRASATHQDAELAEASPNELRGAKGDRLPNVPRLMGTLDIDYELPVRAFKPSIGATLRHVDDRTSGFSGAPATNYHMPEYTTLDLRMAFDFGSIQAQLFARNVTDERGQLSALTGIGVPRISIMQPRTVGLTLSTSF